MVGREGDLAILRVALEDAERGIPRGILIGGEAGIGKSRLVSEFVAALESTVDVLEATCIDLGAHDIPYGPVRALVRQLAALVGERSLLDAAGPGRGALAAVAPELSDADAEGFESLDETFARLLSTFSAERSIVLIVEDVHLADAATLALLRSVVRSLRTGRVLALLTFRTDIERAHPLRAVLAELEQSRAASRHDVARLDRLEVRALATALLGSEPDPAELARVFRRSDGVPFFVEELIGIGETDLPDTLRDVLLARYTTMSDGARAFARMASVGGVRVEHGVLERVAGSARIEGAHGLVGKARSSHQVLCVIQYLS